MSKRVEFTNAAPGTPEHQIFTVCKACVFLMGHEGQLFPARAAEYILANHGAEFSDVQRVAIGTVGEILKISNPFELEAALNAILIESWEALGVRNMPEGAALSMEQRLGFIQGVYAYAAQRIAASLVELQELILTNYEHPTIPAEDPPAENE